MASMWRKAMLYLGLGPDDEYSDDGAYDDQPPVAAPAPPSREAAAVAPRPASGTRSRSASRTGRPQAAPPPPEPEPSLAVRTINPTAAPPAESTTTSSMPPPAAGRPVVRTLPPSPRPHPVSPTSFNEAQEVADKFKSSVPVIMNLQGVDRDLARRLIDFSSGLCYGLGGHMEKVAHQVYLLTPQNVEVSAEDKRRLAERGLFDA